MQFGQQGSSLDTVADVVAGCWFGKNWLSHGRSSLANVPRIVSKSAEKTPKTVNRVAAGGWHRCLQLQLCSRKPVDFEVESGSMLGIP